MFCHFEQYLVISVDHCLFALAQKSGFTDVDHVHPDQSINIHYFSCFIKTNVLNSSSFSVPKSMCIHICLFYLSFVSIRVLNALQCLLRIERSVDEFAAAYFSVLMRFIITVSQRSEEQYNISPNSKCACCCVRDTRGEIRFTSLCQLARPPG